MIRLFLCFVGVLYVSGLPTYRDRIPNGYRVFNPCGAGYWEAVGHYNPYHHTMEKNPFALVKSSIFLLHLYTSNCASCASNVNPHENLT
jgi:hypothetical protein